MDSNILYKTSSPNKKSILKHNNYNENNNQYIEDNYINKSPIKNNNNEYVDFNSKDNNSFTTPQKSPNKNKVSISNESVVIHRYLSKSPIKIIKSKRLFTSNNINDLNNDLKNDTNNNNNNNTYNKDQDKNDLKSINDNDQPNNQLNNDILSEQNEQLQTESNFYESLPTTPNNNNLNKYSILNIKSKLDKLKQCIEYPICKFDKLHEEFTILINNNYKYTKYLIYLLAILLNIALIGYSLNYLGPVFGLVLLTIGITNSITFFKSIKTYQLYRYEGKTFQSSNMSLIEIEHDGLIEKIPILKIWEPKFPSKILFSLFNPLNILIMFKAGPNIEDFICFSGISFSFSIMLYYILDKYDEKIFDEKILFNQLVNEYNHYMRAVPSTKNKSTTTN